MCYIVKCSKCLEKIDFREKEATKQCTHCGTINYHHNNLLEQILNGDELTPNIIKFIFKNQAEFTIYDIQNKFSIGYNRIYAILENLEMLNMIKRNKNNKNYKLIMNETEIKDFKITIERRKNEHQ